MDIKEAYLEYQKNCGIKVGDCVKVLFEVPDRCGGWGDSWRHGMVYMVKKVFRVCNIETSGIILKNNDGITFSFPAFCLQKVEEQEKMIEIDGKKFSLSTVKQALKDHCNFEY